MFKETGEISTGHYPDCCKLGGRWKLSNIHPTKAKAGNKRNHAVNHIANDNDLRINQGTCSCRQSNECGSEWQTTASTSTNYEEGKNQAIILGIVCKSQTKHFKQKFDLRNQHVNM